MTRAVGSGQKALSIALRAVGAAGKEVILPSYVCDAVLSAVQSVDAIPVLCDVGVDWCVDRSSVVPHLSDKTAAIIVVHTFGIHADVQSLTDLGVPVVEDCCQYFAAGMGKSGDISAFSFHATKCLTMGEGGLVATSKGGMASAMFELPESSAARISDIQAALGLSQLSRYDEMLARRAWIAASYLDVLPEKLTARIRSVKDRSMFFRFPLQTEHNFEEVKAAFYDRGVHVRKGVDTLLHRKLGMGDEGFEQSVRLFDETLSIPIYPAMSDEEVASVAAAAKEILD